MWQRIQYPGIHGFIQKNGLPNSEAGIPRPEKVQKALAELEKKFNELTECEEKNRIGIILFTIYKP